MTPTLATPVEGRGDAAPIQAHRGHIPALDGIRGLAVVMVVLFHSFQAEPAPNQPLLRLGYAAMMLGQTGVDLFFVLSGFLITGILVDAKGSRRYFVNFYGRRILRIFPLYYGFAIVALVVAPRILGYPVTGLSWLTLSTFTANFAIANGTDGGMLGHYWSLAIEEQFYLVWPFLVCAMGRVALMRLCLASLIVSAAVRWGVESRGISAFMLTPCRIDTLLVGALIALAARGPGGLAAWSRRAMPMAAASVMAALPLYLILRSNGSPWLALAKYPIIAALYGSLLIAGVTASPGSQLGRFLTLPPLLRLGKYSYGIYIYHPPIVHLVGWMVGMVPVVPGLSAFSPAVGLVSRIFLIGAVSYGLARLSWWGFEHPILSLKRHFEYGEAGRRTEHAGDGLYNRPAGRNDRNFTLGPARAVGPTAMAEE